MSRFSAMRINRLLSEANIGLRPYECAKETKELLDRIFVLFHRFEPNEMGVVHLWLFVPCGEEAYPDPLSWYQVSINQHRDSRFLGINKTLFHFKETADTKSNAYVHELLEWIYEEVLHVIEMVDDGTYNDYVEKNLPYAFRAGTITRKQYNEVILSNSRELKKAEIEELFSYAKEDDGVTEPEHRISQMTVQMMKTIIAECYINPSSAMTKGAAKAVYETMAEGLADSLESVAPESSQAFRDWVQDQKRYGRGIYLCTLYETTSFDATELYLCGDEEYYFELTGSAEACWVDTIRGYLRLRRAGIPVVLSEKETLIKRVTGEELIGFVPRGVDVTVFYICEPYFPGKTIDTYMEFEFDLDTEKKLIERISWIPVSEARLKECGSQEL